MSFLANIFRRSAAPNAKTTKQQDQQREASNHMTTAKDVLKQIKDNDVKYVDFRFTDPRGKWQHVTFDVSIVDEEALTEGIMFDGSSIAGWKAINESDMTLLPDLNSIAVDPFFAASTLSVVCDVVEPSTGQPYNRDPRGVAKKAMEHLKSTGVGDTAFFGPEAEFFVFDDVRFSTEPYDTGFTLDSTELPSNSGTAYEGGNLGHRVRTKGGYFPVPPVDSAQDMRSEMLAAMSAMGVKVEKHHHEVASAQHELGLKFETLVTVADHLRSISMRSIRWRIPTASRRPSCRSRCLATTVRACTSISRSGRTASRSSQATNTPASLRSACGTSAASSSMRSR
jgi:glutamine synthetase